MRAGVVVIVLAAAHPAAAERGYHGSIGGGGSLLLTGGEGDRLRLDFQVDLEPGTRYGGSLAWRFVDQDHHGMLTAGLVFEGAAARPRLVVDLHGDLGADLDQHAPVVGGGIRTTLTILGPLGVGLDTGAYLVIDGVERSRLVLAGNALVVVRW